MAKDHPEKPESADEQVRIFQIYLRKTGLKLTAQRNAIARKVFGTRRHFSAEELIESLRKGRRSVSKARRRRDRPSSRRS